MGKAPLKRAMRTSTVSIKKPESSPHLNKKLITVHPEERKHNS